jgi:hypothetical protein
MSRRTQNFLDLGKEWAFRRQAEAHHTNFAARQREGIFGVGFVYQAGETQRG